MVWAREQTFDDASVCDRTDCDACYRTVIQDYTRQAIQLSFWYHIINCVT